MSKYEKCEQLATETLENLIASKDGWMSFLDTASRMYKYTFDEQILIHAQRPDARACAAFDFWTAESKMNRHIRRGAKVIALIDRESHRLYYVYDAADTVARANQKSKDPEDYIWKIKNGSEAAVNEVLGKNTGISDQSLQRSILTLASKAVQSRIAAYSHEFNLIYQKSSADVVSPAMIKAFMDTVSASVAVMALKRSGFDTAAIVTDQTFADLQKFNSDYAALIGKCTCDIGADVIREIERAVRIQHVRFL